MRPIWIFALVVGCGAAGGEVNTPSDPQEYVACGCGCCGEPDADEFQCVTPQQLNDVRDEDSRDARDPNCAIMGCSIGVRYRVCD